MLASQAQLISELGGICKDIRKAAEKGKRSCYVLYLSPEEIHILEKLGYRIQRDVWDEDGYRTAIEISW